MGMPPPPPVKVVVLLLDGLNGVPIILDDEDRPVGDFASESPAAAATAYSRPDGDVRAVV